MVKGTASYAEVFQRFPAPSTSTCAEPSWPSSSPSRRRSRAAWPRRTSSSSACRSPAPTGSPRCSTPTPRCAASRRGPPAPTARARRHLFDVAARLDEDFEGFQQEHVQAPRRLLRRPGPGRAARGRARARRAARAPGRALLRLLRRATPRARQAVRGGEDDGDGPPPRPCRGHVPGDPKARDPARPARPRGLLPLPRGAQGPARGAEPSTPTSWTRYVERCAATTLGLLAMPDRASRSPTSRWRPTDGGARELLRFLGAYASEQHARALVEAGSFEALTGRRPAPRTLRATGAAARSATGAPAWSPSWRSARWRGLRTSRGGSRSASRSTWRPTAPPDPGAAYRRVEEPAATGCGAAPAGWR